MTAQAPLVVENIIADTRITCINFFQYIIYSTRSSVGILQTRKKRPNAYVNLTVGIISWYHLHKNNILIG